MGPISSCWALRWTNAEGLNKLTWDAILGLLAKATTQTTRLRVGVQWQDAALHDSSLVKRSFQTPLNIPQRPLQSGQSVERPVRPGFRQFSVFINYWSWPGNKNKIIQDKFPIFPRLCANQQYQSFSARKPKIPQSSTIPTLTHSAFTTSEVSDM